MTTFLIILAVIALLLACSFSIHVFYEKDCTIKVGYLFFLVTVFPLKEKAKKKRKKKPKKRKNATKATDKKVVKKTLQKEEKMTISEIVDLVIIIIKSVIKPTKQLLKHVRITKLDAVVIVASEDAAETAMEYGKLSASIYGGLAALQNLMRVKVRRVLVQCDFVSTENRYCVDAVIKIRLVFIVYSAICMLVAIIVNTIRGKLSNDTEGENPKKSK